MSKTGNGNVRRDRREARRVDSLEREKAFAALSTKEKILVLDTRLGKGVGAKRQRERYAALLAEEANPKPKKGDKVHKNTEVPVPVEMPKEGLSTEQVAALHNRGLPEDLKVQTVQPKKGKGKKVDGNV